MIMIVCSVCCVSSGCDCFVKYCSCVTKINYYGAVNIVFFLSSNEKLTKFQSEIEVLKITFLFLSNTTSFPSYHSFKLSFLFN